MTEQPNPPEPMVIGFETIDDLFAFMDANRRRVIAAMTPEQEAITYGCHWMHAGQDYPVFGYILTIAEFEAGERQAGADEAELEYTKQHMMANHKDGFRFGWSYSQWEPRGELGSTHCSAMIPITEAEFIVAKSLNWKLW
jgi:hypothetical protein